MSIVTVSPKYQVVIPKEIRESLGLKPGQKLIALPYEGRIVFVPLKSVAELQGFLPGLDTNVPREDDRV
jgi:AbrB family looped-hinge helix DNA binding protein